MANNLIEKIIQDQLMGSDLTNVLLVGTVDQKRLRNILKSDRTAKCFDCNLESKPGDFAALVTGLNDEDSLLILNFQLLPFSENEILEILVGRCLTLTIGEGSQTKTVKVPLTKFCIIANAPDGGLVSSTVFENGFNFKISFTDLPSLEDIKDRFGSAVKSISSGSTAEAGSDDVSSQVVRLISSCNPEEWVDEFGEEKTWMFDDGTCVTSLGLEHDADAWLEMYDEMEEKFIDSIDGVELADDDAADVLKDKASLLEFKYVIAFKGAEIVYRFIQFGEGEIAGQTVSVPDDIDVEKLSHWMTCAIGNEWTVSELS